MNNPDLQQIGELITDGERFRALCDMSEKIGLDFLPYRVGMIELRLVVDGYRAQQENSK